MEEYEANEMIVFSYGAVLVTYQGVNFMGEGQFGKGLVGHLDLKLLA